MKYRLISLFVNRRGNAFQATANGNLGSFITDFVAEDIRRPERVARAREEKRGDKFVKLIRQISRATRPGFANLNRSSFTRIVIIPAGASRLITIAPWWL